MICGIRNLCSTALTVLALAAVPAQAAVLTVTKTADTLDGACNQDCSLREAVVAANSTAGTDVIILPAGTYILSRIGEGEDLAATGDLDITEDLVILGAGVPTTVIDGAELDRILHVHGASLTLSGVLFQRGTAAGNGGALLNENGDVELTRVQFTSNRTTGATFGGAIFTDGTTGSLTVIESAFNLNLAGASGGAIAARGTELTLRNVTFLVNRANTAYGGALYFFRDLPATINNVTIVSNTAAQDGGGVYSENSAFIGSNAPTFSNTIIAGNTGGTDPDCTGSTQSAGYNAVGVGGGCTGFSAAKNDILGTAADPLFQVTGANGSGGTTPTVALPSGSPALNAGNPAAPGSGNGACELTDQRGATRPAGGRCDIGAFESTTACVPGEFALCLSNGRFRVTATYRTASDPTPKAAHTVTLTEDTGYLYFFDRKNVEATVKVLNGCGVNSRYWVFASGLTNVEVVLTVTDTKTNTVKEYTNPLNRAFRPIQDTVAFNTCP
ncbi:MAG TPA: choice-of-anchor Q domain-containing protein [Thermoanaerobaculia bacterium]|nr:choice-of-anchor Q domain-containing protein [Thermoanaerobaculia bacterium]